MLTNLGRPGDQMVAASSDQALVTAHAVQQANGNLALMLVNKSPNTSYDINVALSGYTPIAAATVFTYGMNSTRIATGSISNAGTTFVRTISPYSLTTVVLTAGHAEGQDWRRLCHRAQPRPRWRNDVRGHGDDHRST